MFGFLVFLLGFGVPCPLQVWKALLNDRAHAGIPEFMVAAKTALIKPANGGSLSSSEAEAQELLQEAAVMVRHTALLIDIEPG